MVSITCNLKATVGRNVVVENGLEMEGGMDGWRGLVSQAGRVQRVRMLIALYSPGLRVVGALEGAESGIGPAVLCCAAVETSAGGWAENGGAGAQFCRGLWRAAGTLREPPPTELKQLIRGKL